MSVNTTAVQIGVVQKRSVQYIKGKFTVLFYEVA